MNEREKVLKAFNQCSDALSNLESKSIMKVFQLLSVQFDIITLQNSSEVSEFKNNDTPATSPQVYLPTSNGESETEGRVSKNSKQKPIQVKKGKSFASKNPQFLSNFDFRPSGKESLKDFFNRYDSKSNLEHNLVFTYYLQEILGEQGISNDHIFSCYRHVGLKIPSFPQTLVDTKKRKGWIDTSDFSNLKVTREGINYIEHEILKKND